MVGMLDDLRCQINASKSDIELLSSELKHYKNEVSDINYDEEISDIYDKINDLNETIPQETHVADEEPNNTNDDTSSSTNNKPEPLEEHKDEDTSKPNDNYNVNIYEDMADLYYGRLYIPDLNIEVNLYYGWQKYITDRLDSANIFFFDDDEGFTIADHNNQAFANLHNVQIGTTAYINNKYLGRIDIVCVGTLTGYNITKAIVDENGNNAMKLEDYMMYTCIENNVSNDVFICLWHITNQY
jgi:sortase (surface protein transpeptidase)